MTRAEINSEIALHFGFKRSDGSQYLVNGMPQWTFPNNWYLRSGGHPNLDVPDFIQIIEDYLALHKKHEFGPPMEYFGRLGPSPAEGDG